jgi:hypothetical protein
MARRRTRAPRAGLSGLWLFLLGIALGAAGFYVACRDTGPDRNASRRESLVPTAREEGARHGKKGRAHEPGTTGAIGTPAVPPAVHASGPSGEPPARQTRIALVIDDLGRSLEDVDTLERLGVPLTYAVLPFEDHTGEVVAALRRHGEEVLCHLPMEPLHGQDPGPGALRLGMSAEQLRTSTAAALEAVPGAAGVNNHMGSGLSADEPSMETILGVLAGRGLFFLDSRTSAQSVGYRVALRLGVPAAERQVFLDTDESPAAIREQFARLLEVARSRGAAVAIGHPHPQTLAVLESEVPRAKALGYEFVPVSYLLDRPDSTE